MKRVNVRYTAIWNRGEIGHTLAFYTIGIAENQFNTNTNKYSQQSANVFMRGITWFFEIRRFFYKLILMFQYPCNVWCFVLVLVLKQSEWSFIERKRERETLICVCVIVYTVHYFTHNQIDGFNTIHVNCIYYCSCRRRHFWVKWSLYLSIHSLLLYGYVSMYLCILVYEFSLTYRHHTNWRTNNKKKTSTTTLTKLNFIQWLGSVYVLFVVVF